MRLFVHDVKSGTCLTSDGGWTESLMEARDFGEPECAISSGRRSGHANLEILATLDDGYPILRVPLQEADRMTWPRPDLEYIGQDPG